MHDDSIHLNTNLSPLKPYLNNLTEKFEINVYYKKKETMKKTYIKPEFESNVIILETSLMGLSGVDEGTGETIIGDSGNGDEQEGDVNKSSLWDEEEDYL